MVSKKRWFLLGVLGTVVGLAVRLVRGRRPEHEQLSRLATDEERNN
jgi:hypothetical protein